MRTTQEATIKNFCLGSYAFKKKCVAKEGLHRMDAVQ